MNTVLISKILTQLSTMQGFPALPMPKSPDEQLAPVAASYAAVLSRFPDSTLRAMFEGVLLRYDERPSVKALAEWAAEIAQARPALPAYFAPETPRLTGPAPASCGGSALAVITDAARQSKASGGSPIPDDAKAIFRQLREREKSGAGSAGAVIVPRAEAGDWGIEHIRQDGTRDRLPARWSEAAARTKAAEQAAKYPHLTVRVWCQSAVGAGELVTKELVTKEMVTA